MGRIGITLERVSQICDEVSGSGERPTIRKVREILGGTGSNSTISRHIRDWAKFKIQWLDASDPHANGIQPAHGSSFATWINKSSKENNQLNIHNRLKNIEDLLALILAKLTQGESNGKRVAK